MTTQDATAIASGAVSVRELVRRRMGVDSDPWRLALVQRDEKWDQVRMRHLLDSLLAGYPVGSILLCRVTESSRVIKSVNGVRQVEDADPAAWQLLDGQQRVNALYSMFTDEGRYGRFYLHMAMRREEPGPVQSRHTKDRALRYIAWRPQEGGEPLEDRDLHLDVSRWFAWTEAHHEKLLEWRSREDDPCAILHDIDPEFALSLPPEAAGIAAERLGRMIHAWLEPSIPVLRAQVQSPLDVLEVFTRINLAGVAVVSTDVYFAAVKTFWTDAEESLDRLAGASRGVLARLDALRFISRLASRGLGQGDLLPLSVDRLAGRNGQPLIDAMQQLTAEDSAVMDRVARFSSWYLTHSELGFGLWKVTRELWDDVLGWVATTARTEETWYAKNLHLIDSYLLGSTLFRYRGVLGDRFHRVAFLEALAAGADGRPYPVEQILAVVRAGGLRGNRRVVRGLTTEDDRQWTADQNGELLTTVAQRIPYRPEGAIDWDHIFPKAQAGRMWSPGDGRRRHHAHRSLINSAGNLWALDAGANRALQDTPPAEKFKRLDEWVSDLEGGYPVWPKDRWSLTSDEVAAFVDVDRLLTDDPESVEVGMQIFREVVTGRTQRLLTEALDRFPEVRLFAEDADVRAGDAAAAHEFSDALGFTATLASPAVDRTIGPAGGDPAFGPGWQGRQGEMEQVVKDVTAALKNDGTRSEWSGPRSEFTFARWVQVGTPEDGTYVAVGITPRFLEDTGTPFWLQINSKDTPHFAVAEARLNASQFSGRIRRTSGSSAGDRIRVWIPLDAPDHLRWSSLVVHLLAQSRQVLAVILGGHDSLPNAEVEERRAAQGSIESVPAEQQSRGAANLPREQRDPESWLTGVAEDKGLGDEFRRIVETARELGLHARFQNNWWIVKLTPPENRAKGFIDIGADLEFWVDATAIAGYLGRSAAEVERSLGLRGRLEPGAVDEWSTKLRALFSGTR